ncbi:hypothetical protein NPIL_122231 [Nephila pilipes]|uniref:Uncharacterized protein n=1 Tax=Nephila pilipes TaxID=299642 RepID=A0A8X6QCD3_NEPPI|nr:hypothetical protein NPIL_122231 [Nephila pilipes]
MSQQLVVGGYLLMHDELHDVYTYTVIAELRLWSQLFIRSGFQRGNITLEKSERAGRQITSVTEECTANVSKMLEEDRQMSYQKTENSLGLNASRIVLLCLIICMRRDFDGSGCCID